jgi:dsRNA-specific ribonuclease
MSNMPPFPKIDGHHDLLLDVYTHKSLRFSGAPLNEEYGDTDRLAILGEKVLDLAVTSYLFSRKPILPAPEIDASLATQPYLCIKG